MIEIYKDEKGEFRWRCKALNGRILADSGEGYKRKKDCLRAIERVYLYIAGGRRKEL